MAESSIEWTEQTWNPTTGCTKISQGCKFCYAEIMHRRLRAMGQEKYSQSFTTLATHELELAKPLLRKKPTTYFVNSMSDLFHKDIPEEFIGRVFDVMNRCPQHTFQVLTKRADRLHSVSLGENLVWTPNIWGGTSVENADAMWRIEFLREGVDPRAIRFLSLEPLLGPLPNLDLAGIDWVIVGGESGHRPRPMREEWVLDIQRQCEEQDVAFFFKQWGGKNKKAAGRLLNGRTYDEMPNSKLLLPI